MKKKGQTVLENAPSIIVIIGLTFLILATFAYIGLKYGDAIATDTTATQMDKLPNVTWKGEALSIINYRNVVCSITSVINATNSTGIINSANYTATNCFIQSTTNGIFNNTNWNVTYTYNYDKPTVATNISDDLITEISNNTSILGIVLTISLISIVLTILIGVFLVIRRPRL